MKKRLTVNSLASHNIKARKKQYALMIVGIVLAMIFSTGAIFMTSSIISGVRDIMDRNMGREDIIFFGDHDDIIADAMKSGIITDYSEGENIGFIVPGGNAKGANVAKISDKAYDMTYTYVLEGRYPEKKGEIALESDLYLSLRTDAQVGDEITVKFKVQSGNGYLEKETEKTYVLTGILHDRRKWISENYSIEFVPGAFVSSEEEVELGGKAQKLIFAVKGGRVEARSVNKFFNRYWQNGQGEPGFDWLVLRRQMYNMPSGASLIIENGSLMVVLAVVMMLASCIGIVNAFNTNLLERKKQIGLLRAIGTTKRQIIKIFGREAFIITLICTPISILVSFFGTKLIISLIGEGLIFIPNFTLLALGAAFSVVCVMAAALVPLGRASKISPMQAVRNVDMMRHIRKRRIKQKKEFNVPLLTAQRNMSFSKGKIAAVSIMLIITIVLSSLGVGYLNYEFEENFLSSNVDYYIRMYDGGFTEYSNFFSLTSERTFSENTLKEILSNPYVKEVNFSESRRINVTPKKESAFLELCKQDDNMLHFDNNEFNINKDNYKEYIEKYDCLDEEDAYMMKQGYVNEDAVNTWLLAINEKELKSIESRLIKGKINIDKINSGEEIVLSVPKGETILYMNTYTDPYGIDVSFNTIGQNKISQVESNKKSVILDRAECDLDIGDEIDLSMLYYYYSDPEGMGPESVEDSKVEKYGKTVKIGAIVECDFSLSIYDYVSSNLSFLTTVKGFETLGAGHRIDNISVKLKGECTEEINESVMGVINSITAGIDNVYTHSEYEVKKGDENTKKVLFTALASIILLLFAVCVNIINNSLTSRIRENKREIGTLMAVGATAGELTKSYIYQLAYMLSIGTVGGLGLLAAFAVGVKIYEKIKSVEVMLPLRFGIPIILCLVLFIVCSANLYIQIKKLTKSSIIENIREL